jgi:Xaa-Pro dipeptidase
MREAEFAELVRAAQRAAGLEGVWVLALFGPNAAYPHGTPEGRGLVEGDLLLVDTGGFLHGYASDITRTWAFPDATAIDDERRRAWQAVHDAQSAALEQIRPGVRCAEVDAAARRVIAAAGFDPDYGVFTHRLGHGIGMEVHEAPYLVRGAEHRLEPGNTMSNEPGIYLPGGFGIRLEDIVAVGEGEAEVFGPRAASLDAPFG